MKNMFKVQLLRHLMGRSHQQTCKLPDQSLCDYWQYLKSFSPCRYELFPLIFWLVLGMSLFGSYCSIREYVLIYRYPNCRLCMSRPRRFNVLSPQLLRKARLIGALFMCHCWLLLLYGLLSVNPNLLFPWILVNLILLLLELMLWLVDLLTCRSPTKVFYPMLRLTASVFMVNCVRKVFENAIKSNVFNMLRLFGFPH